MKSIAQMVRKVKHFFGRRQPRRLSMVEALDISLAYGYAAVDWGRVA